jgi:hypothetical protein
MIRYDLKCQSGHGFDSWFRTSDEYDRLEARGLVTCPDCGSSKVEKALMAPGVARGPEDLSTPRDPREEALKRLRAEIEANSDYVGLSFAAEARKMHAGEIPTRVIHGEARPDDARALLEEGVPVLPLPFAPVRKVN